MIRSQPTAAMRFFKYHALGNDYLILANSLFGEEGVSASLPGKQIRIICDRNRGPGSDGLLIGEHADEPFGFGLRIFNPDGSEAEKSGNGLRIFARSLWDRRLVDESPFRVHTLGGTVEAKMIEGGGWVEVGMGRVNFNSREIPVTGKEREVIRESLKLDGEELEYCAATIGNPHCVVLRQASPKQTKAWGGEIETHPLFPNRVNVQFLEVLDRNSISIQIWERGAGYTLASGSSSCAAASVARKLGLCDADIRVKMPGGTLSVSVDDEYRVTMRGPVTRVGEFETDPEMFGEGG